MPNDLFGVVSRSAPRSRYRRSLTVGSIALHAVVVSAVLVGQQFAGDGLPTPASPHLTFESFQAAQIVDVPPPRVKAPVPASDEPTVSINAAPIVAPGEITRETGLEGIDVGRHEGPPIDGARTSLEPSRPAEGTTPLTPAPPELPKTPIRLHSGVQIPVKTVHVAPVYPAIAQTARVQGIVILEVVIDARGAVTSVGVLRSIALLDQAAIDAVKQWRFTPARLNGEAVPVVMTVTVNFQLDR